MAEEMTSKLFDQKVVGRIEDLAEKKQVAFAEKRGARAGRVREEPTQFQRECGRRMRA
jgi:hypothetical protein